MTTATTTQDPALPTVLFDVQHDPEGSPALPSEDERLEQAFAQFEREYHYPLLRHGSIIGRAPDRGKTQWRQPLSLWQRQRVIEMLARYGIAALHGGSNDVVVIWHGNVEQMAKALNLTDLRTLEAALEDARCDCERIAAKEALILTGMRKRDKDIDDGCW